MTATTPVYGLPYPEDGDLLSTIPDYIEDLAVQVESTIAGLGGVASPGSYVTPTYGSGWADWSDTTTFELFRVVKIGTLVHVLGMCRRTSGSGTTIATLASGYRPTRTTFKTAVVNDVPRSISIDSAGVIGITAPTAAAYTNGQYVDIDALFHTDQP